MSLSAACRPPAAVVSACCDEVILALSAHPDLPEAEQQAKAEGAMTLILGLLPQDAMQLMLAGQAVLFNAMAADAAGDALRGMSDTLKLRTQSNAIACGRLAAKHLDTIARLQGRTAQVQQAATTGAGMETASTPDPGLPPETGPQPDVQPPPDSWMDKDDASWLDEPYVEWLLNTPSDPGPASDPSPETPLENAGKRADREAVYLVNTSRERLPLISSPAGIPHAVPPRARAPEAPSTATLWRQAGE